MNDDGIGTIMVAFCGTVGEESINFVGECIGIADHPTMIFKAENGGCQGHWAAHLCRPATKDEQIEYWKQRALIKGADA